MKKKNKIIITTGILLILIGVCIAAGIIIRNEKAKSQADQVKDTAHVTTTAETTTEETTTIIYADKVIDFDTLKAANPDCYAYIEIPDTVVSYPIMQSAEDEDDNYYLDYTFDRTFGYPGSIYTQRITSKDFSAYNSVIYGHDMADGSYFGGLRQYADAGYFNEHKALFIYTPEKQFEYRVVAESTVNDENLSIKYDIKDTKAIKQFIEDLRNGEAENVFDESYEYKEGDRLITLSTCIGPRPENRRLIVAVLEEELPVRPD